MLVGGSVAEHSPEAERVHSRYRRCGAAPVITVSGLAVGFVSFRLINGFYSMMIFFKFGVFNKKSEVRNLSNKHLLY